MTRQGVQKALSDDGKPCLGNVTSIMKAVCIVWYRKSYLKRHITKLVDKLLISSLMTTIQQEVIDEIAALSRNNPDRQKC
jgi:hypothetical protein